MQRHRIVPGLVVLLLMSGPALAVTIDTFDDGDFSLTLSGLGSTSTTTTGSSMIGGEREVTLTVSQILSQSTDALVDNSPSGAASLLIWNEGDSIKGTLELLYDGMGTPVVGSTDGLGNVDFTESGLKTGFGLLYGKQGDGSYFDVTINITSGIQENNVQSSSVTKEYAGAGFAFIPFGDLAGSADVTNVDAIQFLFDSTKGGFNIDLGPPVIVTPGKGGGDYSFDLLESTVPEPVTMAGLLMGVGGLAGYLRKRRFA